MDLLTHFSSQLREMAESNPHFKFLKTIAFLFSPQTPSNNKGSAIYQSIALSRHLDLK